MRAVKNLVILLFVECIFGVEGRGVNPWYRCESTTNILKSVVGRLIEEIAKRSNCIVFVTDYTHHDIAQNYHASRTSRYAIALRDNEVFFPARRHLQKILMASKTAGCNGYVILLANGSLLSRFLEYVEEERLVNTRGFFVLLYDYHLFSSNLYYIWNKIINVVFIRQYNLDTYRSGQKSISKTVDLVTIDYPLKKEGFVATKYLNTWHRGNFRYRKNHFLQKDSDLRGKTLRVAIFEHMPAVTKESRSFYKGNLNYHTKALGVEFELITIISKLMNFKASYYMPDNIEFERWGRQKTNDTYSGLVGEAIARKAAFFIGDLHYTLHHLKFFDLSTPYNTECLTFLTPKSLTDNSWQLLILPFKLYTWIALLFTLFLGGGTFHLFSLVYKEHIITHKIMDKKEIRSQMVDMPKESQKDKEGKNLYLFTEAQNSMLYTYGMLLLVSLPELPKPWALRILIGWWWIFSILVVVSYRASMTATLANPVARITIDTLAELSKSSVQVGGWSMEAKQFFLMSSDPYSQEIGSKFRLIESVDESIEQVAKGSLCYYENAYFLRYARVKRQLLEKERYGNNNSEDKLSNAKHNLHIMEECIVNMPIALGLEKNSALKPDVDLWIRRIIEAGLVNKWLSDVTEWTKITETKQEQQSEKALVNLHKFHGALVTLGIGYFVSVLALIGENLHWKYIVLKNPKYDKYRLDTFYKKIIH